MNRSGRLALIKTTLSVIPVHIMVATNLPNWFLKALEKIMRAFLWSGMEIVNGGKCLVAWSKVQHPLSLGGLGIHDLKRFGRALRLHWLWLQQTKPDRCCCRMPVKDDNTTMAFYMASTSAELGDGTQIKFWSDQWLQGKRIAEVASYLVGAVSRRRLSSRMVVEALENRRWLRDVTGALTIPRSANWSIRSPFTQCQTGSSGNGTRAAATSRSRLIVLCFSLKRLCGEHVSCGRLRHQTNTGFTSG